MGWWGKLVGGAFGFMLGGPLGALLGGVLGHNFDRGLGRLGQDERFRPGDRERVQTAFFTATFSVMGHLAKADGRISPQEIALAEAVMAQMDLDGERRRAAIRLYERGLCHHLVAGLLEIDGLRFYGITDPQRFDQRVPTVAFTMEGLSPDEIAQRLAAANIFSWNGNFYALAVTERLGLEGKGGLLRVGLAHYNTADEVNVLLGVLADMPR